MPPQLSPISPRPLGQLLLRRGLIRAEQLERALVEQRRCRHRKLLGEILVDLRDCTEHQVAEALAEAHGLPFAAVSPALADPAALSALPREFIETNLALPLFLVDGVLTIAVAEPANVFLVEEIERLSGHAVQVVAATASDIRASLRALRPGGRATSDGPRVEEVPPEVFRLAPPPRTTGAPTSNAYAALPAVRPGSRRAARSAAGAIPQPTAAPPRVTTPEAPDESSAEAPAEKLLNFCLYTALKEGATAVHFEPAQDTSHDATREPARGAARVRFRVDGVMVEKMTTPARLQGAVAARLKAAAGLDASQCRLPQHGRLSATFDGKIVDLEIATAPGLAGEKIVVRFLGADKPSVDLERLGFGYDMLKQWRRLLSLPGGLLLVIGPADCGKRTTLYSSLDARNAPGANLCTIEAAAHYTLPGVNHFRVDPQTGFTAETALESVLRQEPDVLMVWDLPDSPTARLAAQAAAGGRLVLAGLHADDAPLGLSRLTGLGLEPYLIASAVRGVLSQRLVRKLCPACKQPYEPTGSEKRQVAKFLPGLTTLYRPKGCDRCRNLGYAGRIGLFELLVPDDALIDHLTQGAPLGEIRRLATSAGLTPLRADGFAKAKAGLTTLEEVFRVTG